jgi:PREDICTED: hypothetical protein
MVEKFEKTINFDDTVVVKQFPLNEITHQLIEKVMKSKCRSDLEIFDFDYASKISSRARVSPYCFMLSMIYIERMKQLNIDYFRKVSSCELFLVSMVSLLLSQNKLQIMINEFI